MVSGGPLDLLPTPYWPRLLVSLVLFDSLLSKITPKNFDSTATGIFCPFKQRLG